MKKFLHICEVCGKEEMLTAKEAFDDGWDYPPFIGVFGVLSPRTCSDCSMQDTLWYKLLIAKTEDEKMAILNDEENKELIKRIREEGQDYDD